MNPDQIEQACARARATLVLNAQWEAYDVEMKPLWAHPIDDAKLQAAYRQHERLRGTKRPTRNEVELSHALLAAATEREAVWNEAIRACAAIIDKHDDCESASEAATLRSIETDIAALLRPTQSQPESEAR